jgi:hypothetical protein
MEEHNSLSLNSLGEVTRENPSTSLKWREFVLAFLSLKSSRFLGNGPKNLNWNHATKVSGRRHISSSSFLFPLFSSCFPTFSISSHFLLLLLPVVCRIGHPNKGCLHHLLIFWIKGVKRALSVYAPIHGAYALVILYGRIAQYMKDRRRAKQQAPSSSSTSSSSSSSSSTSRAATLPSLALQIIEVLMRMVQNILRSSAFLSLYCTLGWSR